MPPRRAELYGPADVIVRHQIQIAVEIVFHLSVPLLVGVQLLIDFFGHAFFEHIAQAGVAQREMRGGVRGHEVNRGRTRSAAARSTRPGPHGFARALRAGLGKGRSAHAHDVHRVARALRAVESASSPRTDSEQMTHA